MLQNFFFSWTGCALKEKIEGEAIQAKKEVGSYASRLHCYLAGRGPREDSTASAQDVYGKASLEKKPSEKGIDATRDGKIRVLVYLWLAQRGPGRRTSTKSGG